jgi:hypothetical protein
MRVRSIRAEAVHGEMASFFVSLAFSGGCGSRNGEGALIPEFRFKGAKDVDDTTGQNLHRTSSLNTEQKSGGHPRQQKSTVDFSSFQSSIFEN